MANSIPLVITVSADGTIQAAANINNVANAAKKTGEVADFVKSKLAGAFAVGTIVAAGRAALSYSADLQDMADQFGVTASQAEGFIRQIRNVGGSSEKATGILQRLHAYQQKIGNTQSISDFIASVAESYQRTNDFGQILEIVGSKNAAVFRASIEQLSGGLSRFNDTTKNDTAALADFYSEQFAQMGDDAKSWGAKTVVNFALVAQAWKRGIAGFVSGEMEGPYKGLRKFADEFKSVFSDAVNTMVRPAKQISDSFATMREDIAEIERSAKASGLLTIGDLMAGNAFTGPERPAAVNPYTYTNPAFVGPMQKPEKSNRVGSDYQLAPLITALSSAAVVALQKYKEGGSNSIEKQSLIEQKNQTKWARETAENTRKPAVQLTEASF